MSGDTLIGQIGVIFGTILGIAAILYLAYISTKFIGKRYGVKSGGGKKIKVIENLSVGKDSSMMIVRAGGKVFLVGAAPGGINLISELDESEFEEEEESGTTSGMSFASALKSVLKKKTGKKSESGKENEDDDSQEEE